MRGRRRKAGSGRPFPPAHGHGAATRGLVVWFAAFVVACGAGDEDELFPVGREGSERADAGPAGSGAGGTEEDEAGAGGTGGVGGGRPASTALPDGLADDTLLSDLTSEDVLAVCDVLGARLTEAITEDDAARLACTFFALILSTTPDDPGMGTVDVPICQQAVEECLASGLDEGMSTLDCDAEGLAAAASECDIPFGEYEACIDAQAELLAELVDLLSCETLGDEAAAAMASIDPTAPGSVPACARVAEECPALLESESGTDATPPGG